jgi:hypothetical protein
MANSLSQWSLVRTGRVSNNLVVRSKRSFGSFDRGSQLLKSTEGQYVVDEGQKYSKMGREASYVRQESLLS